MYRTLCWIKTAPKGDHMKKPIVLLIAVAILCTGLGCGHKMFVGQRINVDVFGIFEDGQPAQDAEVEIYLYNETGQLYELYNQTNTGSRGMVTVTLPGDGAGRWRFDVSVAGHEEETFLNIST